MLKNIFSALENFILLKIWKLWFEDTILQTYLSISGSFNEFCLKFSIGAKSNPEKFQQNLSHEQQKKSMHWSADFSKAATIKLIKHAMPNPAIIHGGQMADVWELMANPNILSKDRITIQICGRFYGVRLRPSINIIKKWKKKNVDWSH